MHRRSARKQNSGTLSVVQEQDVSSIQSLESNVQSTKIKRSFSAREPLHATPTMIGKNRSNARQDVYYKAIRSQSKKASTRGEWDCESLSSTAATSEGPATASENEDIRDYSTIFNLIQYANQDIAQRGRREVFKSRNMSLPLPAQHSNIRRQINIQNFWTSGSPLLQKTCEPCLKLPGPMKDCVRANLDLKPGVDASEVEAELDDLLLNAMDEKGLWKWKVFLDKLGEGEHRDHLEEWYKYGK